MITRALEAEILRLHHTEHWPIGIQEHQSEPPVLRLTRKLEEQGWAIPLPPGNRQSIGIPYQRAPTKATNIH